MSRVLKEYSSSPCLEFVFSHAHFFFLLRLAHGESQAVLRAQPLLFFLALCVLSRPSGRSSLARCLQCLVRPSLPAAGRKVFTGSRWSVHRLPARPCLSTSAEPSWARGKQDVSRRLTRTPHCPPRCAPPAAHSLGTFQGGDRQEGLWKKLEPLRLGCKHWLPPSRSPGRLKSHLLLSQKGNHSGDLSPNPWVMPEQGQAGVYQDGGLRAAG